MRSDEKVIIASALPKSELVDAETQERNQYDIQRLSRRMVCCLWHFYSELVHFVNAVLRVLIEIHFPAVPFKHGETVLHIGLSNQRSNDFLIRFVHIRTDSQSLGVFRQTQTVQNAQQVAPQSRVIAVRVQFCENEFVFAAKLFPQNPFHLSDLLHSNI